MICRIIAAGDGVSEGEFECDENEYVVIKKAINSLGNINEEDYSPSVYIEIIRG